MQVVEANLNNELIKEQIHQKSIPDSSMHS